MRRLVTLAGVLAVAALTTACGAARCEKPERYAGSGELPPVRVPDDLTPPDESRSLRIPPAPPDEPRKVTRRGPCLESPPDYFEGGQPQWPLRTDSFHTLPDGAAGVSGRGAGGLRRIRFSPRLNTRNP